MKNNNNHLTITDNKKLTIIPSKLHLTYYHNLHNLQNITKYKDQRLELVEIPKGLIEILQNAGFTIEKILDSEPSHIAEILGIDEYVGEIIYQQTRKATRNIISSSNF